VSTTNYRNTFITVAADCRATRGTAPTEGATPSVALRTFRTIFEHPYRYTSDDVIFGVHADRREIPPDERPAAREAFFSKGQPCLRASDLGKRYGWGVHSDAEGRVALYGVESAQYAAFVTDESITVTQAMRSKR
jgi:Family of unknown function (DUF6157)